MDQHTNSAIQGAALRPLSNDQKRDIAILARTAFAQLRVDPANDGMEEDFETWRHAEQVKAVERRSLVTCTNEDFLFLKAHFLALAGKRDSAKVLRIRASTEPRLWALNKLEQECRDAADVLPQARDYAAGFLRNARQVTIDTASEKQLWHCIYVIRRRASQLRRKGRCSAESIAAARRLHHAQPEVKL